MTFAVSGAVGFLDYTSESRVSSSEYVFSK
jgi:hypothetical protein